MTLTVAALVLTNLLYLVGAVGVASLVSGLYVLRHRKPKSVESGIESFSRELQALAPEHRSGADRSPPVSPSDGPRPPGLRARPARPPARTSGSRRPTGGSVATKTGRRIRADAATEAGSTAESPAEGSPSPRSDDGASRSEAAAPAPLTDTSPPLESTPTDPSVGAAETLSPDDGDAQTSEGRGG